jgi:hypothetical protein
MTLRDYVYSRVKRMCFYYSRQKAAKFVSNNNNMVITNAMQHQQKSSRLFSVSMTLENAIPAAK